MRLEVSVAIVKIAYHRGIQGLAIEDETLRCVLLPRLGGKITSLRLKGAGREFMWQDPPGPPRVPPYGAALPEYDIGGFQECFPSIDKAFYPGYPWRGIEVPDHGEVWALSWECETIDNGVHLWIQGVRFPYRLDKWVTTLGRGRLEIRYKLTSLSPFDFRYLWSAHPLLSVRPGMRMMLPEGTRLRTEFSEGGRLGEMGMLHEWPVTTDANGGVVDLSVIHSIYARTHEKLNTVGLTEGWCATYDPDTGEYLAYTFSLDEIPYVGVLLIEGGWPTEGEPYLLAAFEPCTGYPGDLSSAIAWGACETLPAKGAVNWAMVVSLGCESSQRALVDRLSRERGEKR